VLIDGGFGLIGFEEAERAEAALQLARLAEELDK